MLKQLSRDRGHSVLAAILACVLLSASAAPAPAEETISGICTLTTSVLRFELEEARENEQLAQSMMVADQAILKLLEPLWEARLTERLRFLTAKHARDRSKLVAGRSKIATHRARAKLGALEEACSGAEGDENNSTEDFEQLGCQLIRSEKRIARVDLTYYEEVLHSTNELRNNDLATLQEVISAKYRVQNARSELSSKKQRLKRCGAAPS